MSIFEVRVENTSQRVQMSTNKPISLVVLEKNIGSIIKKYPVLSNITLRVAHNCTL